MALQVQGFSRSLVFAACASLLGFSAMAQDTPAEQTLDQVDAFSNGVVQEMGFDRPSLPSASALPLSGSSLRSCKLTASGLYCLETRDDGKQVVRQWKEPQKPSFVDRFACDDTSLGFDAGTCTGLTVDLSGALWVSGRKGANYSLVKVVPQSDLLPAITCQIGGSWSPLQNTTPAVCAREFAAGAGVLTDLDAIDGEVALRWAYGPGVLALNNGVTPLYFGLYGPGETPQAFPGWGLKAGEQLLSTTLLQVPQPVAPNAPPLFTNYLLTVSDWGRVLAKAAISPEADAFEAYVVPEATPPIVIDPSNWGPCIGLPACDIGGATLAATSETLAPPGALAAKSLLGRAGLGVDGDGEEINEGQSLTVTYPKPYPVNSIKILFLFNGPEFDDRAEVATVIAGVTRYTLSVSNEADDGVGTWSGPGTVSKCDGTNSDTTSSGTGCFIVENPFPGPVTTLQFTVDDPGTDPFGGNGTNTSDYSVGGIDAGRPGLYGVRSSFKTGRAYLSDRDTSTVSALLPDDAAFTELLVVDNGVLSTAPASPIGLTVAPGNSLDFTDPAQGCANAIDEDGDGGCVLVTEAGGTAPAAKFGAVKLQENSPSGAVLFQITQPGLPDCRYVPFECIDALGIVLPVGATLANAIDALIAYKLRPTDAYGVIVPLDPNGTNRRNPAAQLLNVTPLLPEDVTSRFDDSGAAPNGLPPLLISRQVRGQQSKQFRIDALFFKADTGIVFVDTYETEFDVSKLTGGTDLGCEAPASPTPLIADLLKLDVIATVSETYRSVGGKYIDTIINTGCRNPAKGTGTRISLFPYTTEVAPDTWGPTIRSSSPKVTTNNDAVFARLAQSLWEDLGTSRKDLACKQVDTTATTTAPLTSAQCSNLSNIWSIARLKLNLCVTAAFYPYNGYNTSFFCGLARKYVVDYQTALAAIPAAPTRDVANRIGEQKARTQTFLYFFDTRFRPSIRTTTGYCREWGRSNCAP